MASVFVPSTFSVLQENLRYLDRGSFGRQITYEGDPFQLTSNGVSKNGPKITPGTIVYLCKNQYTECPEKVRVHVFFNKTTPVHGESCTCRICGSEFEMVAGSCTCDDEEIKNPMHEACCIQ